VLGNLLITCFFGFFEQQVHGGNVFVLETPLSHWSRLKDHSTLTLRQVFK